MNTARILCRIIETIITILLFEHYGIWAFIAGWVLVFVGVIDMAVYISED